MLHTRMAGRAGLRELTACSQKRATIIQPAGTMLYNGGPLFGLQCSNLDYLI